MTLDRDALDRIARDLVRTGRIEEHPVLAVPPEIEVVLVTDRSLT